MWSTITDFKNCKNYISSIVEIDVLEEPKDTLLGFKWKEKRIMFGKEATETMWITDFKENEFYQTRAESHGSIYTSRMTVAEKDGHTELAMSLGLKLNHLGRRFFSCIGFLFKGAMKKAVTKDLQDIKNHLEK